MTIAAVVIGLAIGVVLGGLGGGGGVLTVPALVYLLGESPQEATGASAIIVGAAALTAVVTRVRGVDWRLGIAFGLAGIPAAYLGTLLNRAVPAPVLLLAFAVLAVVTALLMLRNVRAIRPKPVIGTDARCPWRPPRPEGTAVSVMPRPATGRRSSLHSAAEIVCGGIAVGFLAGFLGVGGGFLIVPVLTVVLKLPVHRAIATSLLIIVVNSVSAVVSRAGAGHLDWAWILPLAAAAAVGAVVGRRLAGKLSATVTRRAFAALLMLVGVLVGLESIVAW
ncbi:sulfite exporter TauE/SafE family protein [Amycolatopsis pigmentata]|uniref:Probable membrane transporter protein n=1 Tax=Amycolatopsis pigmentata TaxID=450801 RepID=A0ABW5FRQ9_9PSEU